MWNTVLLFLLLFIFPKITVQRPEDNLEYIYERMSNVVKQYINIGEEDASLRWTREIDDTRDPLDVKYDFIVVGSGSAGSVLANRLSEVPHWSVLLLEAGKGENYLAQIPIAAAGLAFTHYNWEYYMEYQPNMCLGMNGLRMHWPRGRALGGTSVINYMIHTRGRRTDYDRWARDGNPGWSYDEVLPYLIKSENSSLRKSDFDLHGHSGYLSVADSYQSPLVTSFVEGCQELGYPEMDYNSNLVPLGAGTVQANVLRGARHTHARAFLRPVRHRKNLHILTSAYVTKILIDPNTKQAYGVEYQRNGKTRRVGATKEVVLSAGTFNSAQLLMLAGIGPRQHLEELGIPVLEDLPVGQNLHDHLTYVGLAFLVNQDVALLPTSFLTKDAIVGFLTNGTGPYTSLGGVEGIGYIKTNMSQEIEPIPDIELIFVGGSLASDLGFFTRIGMNIRHDVYDNLFRPIHHLPAWTIFPMLLHPRSIGWMKLKSTSPYDYPLFHGNFYTDPEQHDIRTMLAAIRFIQKLAKTRAFARYGSRLNPNPVYTCRHYQFDSDDYWLCALRSLSVTLHHQVGTVKMGPPTDPGAVVNHELKVYGIGGLRVADCSVIPFALGAHTSAPSTMVGEKAADLIKRTWGETLYV